MIKVFMLPVFAYLLGSIPWGIVLTRLFTSVDIQSEGSGNIGATNVARIAGSTLGILTLIGDMLKGGIPVWIAVVLATPNSFWGEIYISLVALAAFSGHLYPVYMRFKKGGKGVATAAGCFAVISPVSFMVAILVFIMFVCWLNIVAVASLAAAAVLPVAVWKATGSGVLTGCAVVTAILIYFRHTDNIKRLLKGTEPVIWK
ncbi:MAG: glycerol-3-phosphate 1-O-acyltransferase PlsY [Deltaproteobacteria bacterium]|nr:glycerol-3-phosphate 1-O-acyltransferase PlsY [Deltaproteobacteria bacterium]MBW1957780.1 glycerol-3-phosphate 1-O-acyltransferase PlsY [Deltaproteobacteria bacterium]MBW2013410.1 glycerol-3-phosphate 1-O-acyltransferase PlsY [Deltaproteobacteria bacterium]MBW2088196.1 glycerol-3-phosphate 1-O-acyltransferase PlsY [Deltaproteobacteria bacterium]